MELKFSITNQTLKRVDENKPVEKSQDYLYCYFDFSTNDWEKATNKYAIFTNEEYNDEKGNALAYEIIDNKCLVPNEILNSNELSFKVNVVGTNESGLYILPTSVEYVRLNKTGSLDGMQPSEKAPIIYKELLNKINSAFTNLTHTFDESNGKLVLNFVKPDGQVKVVEIDLPTEELVKNVEFDSETKDINIEWGNGQTTKIPLKDLITKDYNKLENKPFIPQKLSDLILDVDLGVNEEDVMNIINENAEQTDTLEIDEATEIGIGTSETFNAESDEQVPTSKAVSDFVASAGGGKLYEHYITLRSMIYDSPRDFNATIICNINEPFTLETLIAYYNQLGITMAPIHNYESSYNDKIFYLDYITISSNLNVMRTNMGLSLSNENTISINTSTVSSKITKLISDTVTEL